MEAAIIGAVWLVANAPSRVTTHSSEEGNVREEGNVLSVLHNAHT